MIRSEPHGLTSIVPSMASASAQDDPGGACTVTKPASRPLTGCELKGALPLALVKVTENEMARDLEWERLEYAWRYLPATARLKIMAYAFGCFVIAKFTALFNWGGKL